MEHINFLELKVALLALLTSREKLKLESVHLQMDSKYVPFKQRDLRMSYIESDHNYCGTLTGSSQQVEVSSRR